MDKIIKALYYAAKAGLVFLALVVLNIIMIGVLFTEYYILFLGIFILIIVLIALLVFEITLFVWQVLQK